MSLTGRCALVTGASRGIGRAIAIKLASLGADIGVGFLNSPDLADDVIREIRSGGRSAIPISGDVSNPGEAEEMVQGMVQAFKRIDILVNSAGIVRDYPLAGMEDKEWLEVLGVNLTGTFNMCRSAARYMMVGRYGRIINISSFITRLGGRGQANYSASKGGVEAMTRALAVELAGRGITVNAVAPGAVETDMSRMTINAYKERLLPMIPAGRLGRPEDVASLVGFLACEEAGYITGEVIGVTGGLGLWGG